jgi:hypothetical protein
MAATQFSTHSRASGNPDAALPLVLGPRNGAPRSHERDGDPSREQADDGNPFNTIERRIALPREHTSVFCRCAARLMINLSRAMMYLDPKRCNPEK